MLNIDKEKYSSNAKNSRFRQGSDNRLLLFFEAAKTDRWPKRNEHNPLKTASDGCSSIYSPPVDLHK